MPTEQREDVRGKKRGQILDRRFDVGDALSEYGFEMQRGRLVDVGPADLSKADSAYEDFMSWVEQKYGFKAYDGSTRISVPEDQYKELFDNARNLMQQAKNPSKEGWVLAMTVIRNLENPGQGDFKELRREWNIRKACKKALRDVPPAEGLDIPVWGMVRAGCRDIEDAKRFITLWNEMAEPSRPFGSGHNPDPKRVYEMAQAMRESPLWVIEQAIKAGEKPGRMSHPAKLFDAAKAWKINPTMWKNVAERVGRMELWQRMVADGVLQEVGLEFANTTNPQNQNIEGGYGDRNYRTVSVYEMRQNMANGSVPGAWSHDNSPTRWQRDRGLRDQFWSKLQQALSKGKDQAIAEYVPDTKIHRKRLLKNVLPGFEGLDDASKKVFIEGGTVASIMALSEGNTVKALELLEADSINKMQESNNGYGRRSRGGSSVPANRPELVNNLYLRLTREMPGLEKLSDSERDLLAKAGTVESISALSEGNIPRAIELLDSTKENHSSRDYTALGSLTNALRKHLIDELPGFEKLNDSHKQFLAEGGTSESLAALSRGDTAKTIELLDGYISSSNAEYDRKQRCESVINILTVFGNDWQEWLSKQGAVTAELHEAVKTLRNSPKADEIKDFILANPDLPGAEQCKLINKWEALGFSDRSEQDRKLPYGQQVYQAQLRITTANIAESARIMPESMKESFGSLPLWQKILIIPVAQKYYDELPWGERSGWEYSKDNTKFRDEINRRFDEVKAKGQVKAIAEDLPDTPENRARASLIFFGKAGLTLSESEGLSQGAGIKALAGLKIDDYRKAFKRVTNSYKNEEAWCGAAAVGLATVFGNRADKWLKDQETAGINIHDATYWLPSKSSGKSLEGLGEFLSKHAWDNNASFTERPLDYFSKGKGAGEKFKVPVNLRKDESTGQAIADIVEIAISGDSSKHGVRGDGVKVVSLDEAKAMVKNIKDFARDFKRGLRADIQEREKLQGEDLTIAVDKATQAFNSTSAKWLNLVNKGAPRATTDLSKISGNWESFTPEERELPFKQLVALAQTKQYPNRRSEKFALEAAQHSVSQTDYPKYEDIYLRSQNVPEPFSSIKRWEKDEFTAEFLPRSAVETGFFGHYTNCCQRLGGIGNSCAISTMSDPFSQLLAIRNKEGKIIAGSWAWEATNQMPDSKDSSKTKAYKVACFDNIEALGLTSEQQKSVLDIYKQIAKDLSNADYRKVTIGTGLGDVALDGLQSTEPVKLPERYSGYTDARGQVLLIENPSAVAVEKEVSKVWVRGALEDDLKEAEKVAKACYPAGHDHVTPPDDPNQARGLVLMHEEKGVIGYAVWDESKRYITDVAVLPEFHRYSQTLLNGLMDHCRQGGESWEADARKSSSWPLLLTNAKRGAIDLEVFSGDRPIKVGDVEIARSQEVDNAGTSVRKREFALKDTNGTPIDLGKLDHDTVGAEETYKVRFKPLQRELAKVRRSSESLEREATDMRIAVPEERPQRLPRGINVAVAAEVLARGVAVPQVGLA
jgi:hypothetical protein